jgi:hypothetical protein
VLIYGLLSEQFSDLFLLFIKVSDREELVVDLLGIGSFSAGVPVVRFGLIRYPLPVLDLRSIHGIVVSIKLQVFAKADRWQSSKLGSCMVQESRSFTITDTIKPPNSVSDFLAWPDIYSRSLARSDR